MTTPRTYLYVPGYRPDRMDKAASSAADAVILDLEDSVPVARKDEARATVAAWLDARPHGGPELWVRVNPGSLEADISATMRDSVAGLVVPKAEMPLLASVEEILAGQERRQDARPGRYRVIALVETARGLLDAADLAAASRVARLGLGAADLTAELGINRDGDTAGALESLMLTVIVASAAARLIAPVAPTSTDFRDLNALRDSTIGARDLGFRARTCIHPAQLATVAAAFTPSPEELARARELLADYNAAVVSGHGVLTDSAGRLVDEAVVRSAREVVARAPQDPRDPGQPG